MKFLSFTKLEYFRLSVSSFYFIQGLVFSSWASRIPDIKNSLQMNDAQLGSALFALPVGELATMALAGYAVSRFGSKISLSLAAILNPLALVCLGCATSMWQLVLGLVFFGITGNLSNISINTQGVGVERLYRSSIMASFHGLWSLAGFIGGLIGSWMVGFHVIPFYHFCIIAVVSWCVLMIMRNSMLPRDNHQAKNIEKQPAQSQNIFIKPDRYILLLGIIAFGSMVCEGSMFDWSGVYFEQEVHPPDKLVRLGYVAFMFAMTCGRFTADWFVTRFGAIPVIQTSGVLIASGLLLAIIFPHLTTATLGFMMVGFGTSSIVPLCYSMAGKSKTILPGLALAAVSTIGFLGFLIGPPIIGFVAHALNLRWSFGIIALIGFAATGIAPLLKKFQV